MYVGPGMAGGVEEIAPWFEGENGKDARFCGGVADSGERRQSRIDVGAGRNSNPTTTRITETTLNTESGQI